MAAAHTKETKRAFSTALKELLRQEPFQKISIADICGYCNKNRKCFYYYYKDKYDLANITFDEEFPYLLSKPQKYDFGNTIVDLCRHLSENKSYYKRLLETDCQNSFSEHLRQRLRGYFSGCSIGDDIFACDFWADAVFYSIKEWLLSRESTPFSLYCDRLLACIRNNTYKTH